MRVRVPQDNLLKSDVALMNWLRELTLGTNTALDMTFLLDNIAALTALDTSALVTNTQAFIKTKKATYYLDTTSTATADGNFVVSTLSGAGRWIRQLDQVPEWQAKAVNGTGFYIDPIAGNDEAAGDLATPIKSVREFCARLWGADFVSTSPRLTALATSSVASDAIFSGFTCAFSVAPLLFFGSETVLDTATLTAAGDLDTAVSAGFLTTTTTDFLALGYESTTTRALYAKRANTAGSTVTYAALQRAHNAGPNLSVDISPQWMLNPTTGVFSILTTQAFAAADVVSLVTRPRWPGLQAPASLNIQPINLDFAQNATIDCAGTCRFIGCGFLGGTTNYIQAGSLSQLGCLLNGTHSYNRGVEVATQDIGIGTRLTQARVNLVNSMYLLNRFTIENLSTLDAQGSGAVFQCIGRGWIQNSASLFTGTHTGVFNIDDSLGPNTIGIGSAVTAAASVLDGSRFQGVERINNVSPFTSATPWTVGEAGSFATSELGVLDASTMSSILMS